MPNLPRKLSRGDALPASWLNRLLDWCRGSELRAGPGIRLSRTPSGTTISAPGRGSGGAGGDEWPAVFTVKYENGTAYMWLPKCDDFGPGQYALLNGSQNGVEFQAEGSEDGWVAVGTKGQTFYVSAKFSVDRTVEPWVAKATLQLTGSGPTGNDDVYIPLAHVDKDGTVLQLHSGVLSLVHGLTDKVETVERVYYDADNKQIRAAKITSHFERGVCLGIERDDEGTGENDDIIVYFEECECEE